MFCKKLKVICPMLFTLFSRLSLSDTSQITVQAFTEEFFPLRSSKVSSPFCPVHSRNTAIHRCNSPKCSFVFINDSFPLTGQ